MSHFYAAIPTSARRTVPTACAHGRVTVYAAGWGGRITTHLWHDIETGEDKFEVSMIPHEGQGDRVTIASGIVGKSKTIRRQPAHSNKYTR